MDNLAQTANLKIDLHEKVCAERQAAMVERFNKTDVRFDRIDDRFGRIEWFFLVNLVSLVGGLGTIIYQLTVAV